jgi:hypothetical protein
MTTRISHSGARPVASSIRTIRGQKVILDVDLATIYGVPTKRLNEQAKRNPERFPPDFMFRLSLDEAEQTRGSGSQIATLKRGQNIKYLPYAFTEHGAIMAANVLNSPQSIQMSVHVVRAFVQLRNVFAAHKELADQLAKLERRASGQDKQIGAIFEAIRRLMAPTARPKREIGFHVKAEAASHRVNR